MDPGVQVALAVTCGLLVLAIGIATATWLWRRGIPTRAQAAALEAFVPFAARFGVAVAPGEVGGLPSFLLAGPRGLAVQVRAELVSGGAPMNDEPNAWMRKTLVVVGYALLGVLLLLYGIALSSAANTSYSSNTSSTYRWSGSHRVRRTTIVVPLPAYFGPLVIKAKHGLWRRLFANTLQTGDGAFDAAFWTNGPPDHARSVLTPQLRAALLAFRREHGRFAIESGRLTWSRRSYATEGLDRVLDGLARLTTALG